MTRAWVRQIVMVGVVCGCPGVAWAQQGALERASTPERPHITLERRQELYEQAKLSHATALRRSLVLPGLGSIYADRVFKGMLLMGASGMSLAVFAGGAVREDRTFMVSGGAAFLGLYTYSAITSYGDVSAYNATLRNRYKVMLVPTLSTPQKGLALRLEF